MTNYFKDSIVYYELDDSQVKTLSYQVEYYKDNVKVLADTETKYEVVQRNAEDKLRVDVNGINVTDKYLGYKVDTNRTGSIPSEVTSGTVIKVYYVKDEFDYTVKYFYNDVEDTDKA